MPGTHASPTLSLEGESAGSKASRAFVPAAIIVQQGRVLDYIDGETQRKESPEEYVRQEIAKSLVREYGYPVGRYQDPNDPDVMHEGHTVYRAETSPDWNTDPNEPTSLPLGPGEMATADLNRSGIKMHLNSICP